MRKVKVPKITWQYIYGDNPTPEQLQESKKILDGVYDRIFKIAVENIRKREENK